MARKTDDKTDDQADAADLEGTSDRIREGTERGFYGTRPEDDPDADGMTYRDEWAAKTVTEAAAELDTGKAGK